MENITDALIMAGQMLIFIIALSICMSSFTTVRESINNIVSQRETIEMAKSSDNKGYLNYIDSKNKNSTRIVGSETVVSSIYRSVKENYEIYIKLRQDTFDEAEIEATGAVIWTAKEQIDFGENQIINKDEKLIKFTIGKKQDFINERANEILSKYDGTDSFYDIIRTRKFHEYLGEYQNSSDESISSENKSTKRIITYVEVV